MLPEVKNGKITIDIDEFYEMHNRQKNMLISLKAILYTADKKNKARLIDEIKTIVKANEILYCGDC